MVKSSPPKKGSKLTLKVDFSSPVKKKPTWGNNIDVIQTDVDPICIAVVTRFDKVRFAIVTSSCRTQSKLTKHVYYTAGTARRFLHQAHARCLRSR